MYLELAALETSHALEHRLDDVPLHAVEQVHPAPLQILIHLGVQQHLEILDVKGRPLQCTGVQSVAVAGTMTTCQVWVDIAMLVA